jgi:ribosomal-protein-serine acetyltransferase
MLICRIDNELELRVLQEEHADALASLEAGDLSHSQGEWVFRPGEHVAFIKQEIAAHAAGKSLPAGIWQNGQLVGVVLLHDLHVQNKTAGLDFALDARFRARGIMTKSCRAIISHAFSQLGLNRVEIQADVANAPSCTLAQRLGFVKEGVIRDRYWNGQEFRSCALYSILARDGEETES